jgi:formylglycine-generating enzyme required for sulfatase activity
MPSVWSKVVLIAACSLAGLCLAPAPAADLDDSDVDLTVSTPREFTNSVGMQLVRVPKGTFRMGAPADEKDRESDEGPVHEVEISRDFYVGATEVTQRQWQAVMGRNPSYFSKGGIHGARVQNLDTADFPIENVSWNDVQVFCKKLNAKAEERRFRVTYRLPTEAEWEYAARGGPVTSSKPYHAGPPSDSLSSVQANFDGNSPAGRAPKGPYLQRTCKVASYRPNRLGLYDVHGNLWEWTADWYDDKYYGKSPRKDPAGPTTGSSKAFRGGSFGQPGAILRVANRGCSEPNTHYEFLGFRVAATIRTP